MDTKHKAGCEGHIECPNCGEMCARPVVVKVDGGVETVDTVVCLGCFKSFAVTDESPAATSDGAE